MNSISINNNSIERKIYNNEPVVTFKDIDLVHERPEGTASRNFRTNKKHFIENVDFYNVTTEKCKSDEIRRAGFNNPRGGYLFTESGYLMLVKSFTDDLAWEVQRQLVNSYFRLKEISNNEPYKIKNKSYQGVPCMTIKDLAFLCGYDRSSVGAYIRENSLGELLTYNKLKDFKRENTDYEDVMCSLYVLYKDDVFNIIDNFRKLKECKEFLDEYFKDKYFEPISDMKILKELMNLKMIRQITNNFSLNEQMRMEFDYIISKEYVKLGFLDKPVNDLNINHREGWNLLCNIANWKNGLERK
ncbi:ORF6N domain-containing protein [Anaerococcus porci]|uniref:ORF6N domain-containing protein n=1 Tax=Anaerococcus porci TaxID=2652269 RepID=UPI002A75C185|nr:ORF6N domain-containing protein [Anaerococcus porci]MDY3006020.1 ORF6N domain-containing protein [Anaerococcus porci]